MTIRDTLHTIRAMSPRLSVRWRSDTREYRVTLADLATPTDQEACAYYTQDADDAIATAQFMLRERSAKP